jgi:adenylate cyclase
MRSPSSVFRWRREWCGVTNNLGDWDRAIRAFQQCLKANEHDKLSDVYIERCERLKAAPPADWDGVWRMTSK